MGVACPLWAALSLRLLESKPVSILDWGRQLLPFEHV
jgi:hypothetical protein